MKTANHRLQITCLNLFASIEKCFTNYRVKVIVIKLVILKHIIFKKNLVIHMSYLEWKEIFSVGIKKVDEQHMGLVRLINELHDANKQGTSRLFIVEALEKLITYTIEHFNDEEKLFVEIDYPGSVNHLKEHNDFKLEVEKLKKESATGSIVISLKTIDFLKDWTITHILGTDKEFGNLYCKNKK